MSVLPAHSALFSRRLAEFHGFIHSHLRALGAAAQDPPPGQLLGPKPSWLDKWFRGGNHEWRQNRWFRDTRWHTEWRSAFDLTRMDMELAAWGQDFRIVQIFGGYPRDGYALFRGLMEGAQRAQFAVLQPGWMMFEMVSPEGIRIGQPRPNYWSAILEERYLPPQFAANQLPPREEELVPREDVSLPPDEEEEDEGDGSAGGDAPADPSPPSNSLKERQVEALEGMRAALERR